MRVAHCADQSENDGPLASTIVRGAKLETDMSQAQEEFREAEANCGKDLLALMVDSSHLSKRTANSEVH